MNKEKMVEIEKVKKSLNKRHELEKENLNKWYIEEMTNMKKQIAGAELKRMGARKIKEQEDFKKEKLKDMEIEKLRCENSSLREKVKEVKTNGIDRQDQSSQCNFRAPNDQPQPQNNNIINICFFTKKKT